MVLDELLFRPEMCVGKSPRRVEQEHSLATALKGHIFKDHPRIPALIYSAFHEVTGEVHCPFCAPTDDISSPPHRPAMPRVGLLCTRECALEAGVFQEIAIVYGGQSIFRKTKSLTMHSLAAKPVEIDTEGSQLR